MSNLLYGPAIETPAIITDAAITPRPRGQGVLKLRDYQNEAADCAFDAWREHASTLLTIPTGAGKTLCAAEIICRWPGDKRILFIAHTEELIDQAAQSIAKHFGEMPTIEMGDRSEESGGHPILDRSRVLVASIQTMSRRMERFDPKNFGLVIFDEAHRAPANSYRRLWKYFQDRNKDIKALLLTATPYRADGITMSCMADSVCYEMDIRDAIDEGWLVTIKQKYVVVKDLDFSSCRTVAKDFNQQDLESVMLGGNNVDGLSENERREALARQERMLHAVAVPSIEEAAGKPGLVFCVTVEHATRMAEILRRYPGVTAEVIHGAMDKTVRRDLIQRYRKGQIQWLVSVACLNEGFDAPNAAVIVDAAPTKSKNRYVQRVGRGTRPEPGVVDACTTAEERRNAIANSSKPHVTILDFVGSSGKHKLISTADILAGDMPEALVEEAKKDMQRTGKAEEIRQAAWRKKEERDEQLRQLQEQQRRKAEERRLKAAAIEEARRARITAKVTYEAQNRDPFNKADVAPVQVQPKFRGGSTDQQVRYLACLGIKEETSMTWTKAQAGAVIDKLSNQTGPEYIMRFGRNKGKRLKDIDFEYLRWAGENIKDNAFQDALAVYRQQVINDRKRVAK